MIQKRYVGHLVDGGIMQVMWTTRLNYALGASLMFWSVAGCGGRAAKPRVIESLPDSMRAVAARRARTVPKKTLPRPVSYGFGGPCLRPAGVNRTARSGTTPALRAQHVLQVDRVSPQWLVQALRHIAQSGGCVGCAHVGATWKPSTVGFHVHLRGDGALRMQGRPATLASLAPAVQSCFNMLDSAGMHVLLTTAPNQRRSARLTAVLKRLLIPGVSVHLYSNRP